MERHNMFTYLRLKLVASLLRVFIRLTGSSALRRDRLLAKSIEVQRERFRIPSREKNRYIEAEIYSPTGKPTAKSPILVNWHGSGFVFPMMASDELYCARVARDTGITVLNADYRKSPENPFPAPIEDAEDTLKWVAAQDRFDLTRVSVSGFSAGGNIALVAASSLRKELVDAQIRIAVAIYPVTDISIAPEAKTVPKPIETLPPFVQHFFNKCYVPDITTRKDPRVSPSFADPAEFPRNVVILTCDGDVLDPEASELAAKLDDGTRKVVHQRLKGVPHAFDKGCKEGTNGWARREETYDLIVRVLKETMA